MNVSAQHQNAKGKHVAIVTFNHNVGHCLVNKMDSIGSQSSHTASADVTQEESTTSGIAGEGLDLTNPPSPKCLGSWNTWGINGPQKLRSVRNWINKYQLGIVGLLETKVSLNNLKKIEVGLNLSGWNFLSNITNADPCRILVGWDTSLFNLTLIHIDVQWITCKITSLASQESARITFVYGRNTHVDRRPLWDYISSISHLFNDLPWVLLGDFNAILQADQKVGGDARWLGHHEEFHDAIHQA
ncbi:hypothetical protein OIU77_015099 [Salix suchowensis]|uniref:Endonuclease/exonuclease/phosphatase domain-containing protein n=1 Tax=Salix suchowensis TaxID=1278906 RepID=A0ABQ8ZSF9_9ROSI|nr:hypothetical protein OIU77_015099 [Salix suchowensis]